MNTEIKTKCNCNRYHHNLCPNFLSNPENKADTEIKTKEEWEEVDGDIIVSWDIADGGDNWVVQFWKVNIDGRKQLIQQLDKNSDYGGSFTLHLPSSHQSLSSQKEQFATQIIEALEGIRWLESSDEARIHNQALYQAQQIIK